MDKATLPTRTKTLLALCFAACLAVMLGLVACGGTSGSKAASGSSSSSSSASSANASTSADATISFTDSAGRTVQLPANIERVAITGPVSQMFMITLAPEKMVGLSRELSDTEKAYFGNSLASLEVYGQIYGGKGDFNKEAVANADPQVVIDIGEAKESIVEDMDAIQESIGIPCIHIEASFDSYDDAYRQLGELLGVQDRANMLADYCANAYKQTTDALANVPESERVRVAYLLGTDGLNAMGKGSFQATVVDKVADNVAVFDQPGGSGQGSETSLEQIALWDPELIVFAPGSIYDTAGEDAAWQTLTAIQSGNYYAVPGTPYNWLSSPPGINQVLGYQWFARLCYPDQFSDSIADVAKDFYKTFFNYDLSDDECNDLIANSVPKA